MVFPNLGGQGSLTLVITWLMLGEAVYTSS